MYLPYPHREQLFHDALEEERSPSLLCQTYTQKQRFLTRPRHILHDLPYSMINIIYVSEIKIKKRLVYLHRCSGAGHLFVLKEYLC